MAEDQTEAHDTSGDHGYLIGFVYEYGRVARVITEAELRDEVDNFADLLRETQEYKDYIHMVEVLHRKPELYDKTMQFRKENYFLQHAPEHEDIYDRMSDLRNRNEDLLNTPEVYDYLMAEWAFFHMMQELFDRLMTEINF